MWLKRVLGDANKIYGSVTKSLEVPQIGSLNCDRLRWVGSKTAGTASGPTGPMASGPAGQGRPLILWIVCYQIVFMGIPVEWKRDSLDFMVAGYWRWYVLNWKSATTWVVADIGRVIFSLCYHIGSYGNLKSQLFTRLEWLCYHPGQRVNFWDTGVSHISGLPLFLGMLSASSLPLLAIYDEGKLI